MANSENTYTVEPILIDIPTACQMCGLSRAELYRRLADGHLLALKTGRRTLIDVESLKEHIAGFKLAQFRPRIPKAERESTNNSLA